MIETKQNLRVRQIGLDNPRNGNSLDIELCSQLLEALDTAADDQSVGAILLTGNGADFCSGMDLNEQRDADSVQLGGIHQRLFSTIQRIHKPIVAAVQGKAFAGGTGLVANAHIVVAHRQARFGLTEVTIGYWPVFVFRAVEHAIGERRTMELSLTGREFGAEESLLYGLVTEISPDPVRRAGEIAARIAAFSPSAINIGLSYAHRIQGRGWEQAGEVGTDSRRRLLATRDYAEGVCAAIEKREPKWPSLSD
jgi:enoyl-CoA hydratase/carnithine racemase